MSRPRPEEQQGQQGRQQQLYSPLGKPPLSPQLDSSLITSSVRKRKGELAAARAAQLLSLQGVLAGQHCLLVQNAGCGA